MSLTVGVIEMKRALILLAVCLTFPLSVFAADTTDFVIDSGIESMVFAGPCP